VKHQVCVRQALQRAVKLEGAEIGWSMLTVAHRLQTIMDYDRVAGMAGVPPLAGILRPGV
jgi:hypothetical protein